MGIADDIPRGLSGIEILPADLHINDVIEPLRVQSGLNIECFYQSSDNALALRDWLLTEDGQDFVEECGYVRAK